MSEQFRVVVIGGGVVGCSVLYHLAKRGWKDICLLERDVLAVERRDADEARGPALGGVHLEDHGRCGEPRSARDEGGARRLSHRRPA